MSWCLGYFRDQPGLKLRRREDPPQGARRRAPSPQLSIAEQDGDALRREGVARGIVHAIRSQSQRRRSTVQIRGQCRFKISKRTEIASLSAVLSGNREQRHAGAGSHERHIRGQ